MKKTQQRAPDLPQKGFEKVLSSSDASSALFAAKLLLFPIKLPLLKGVSLGGTPWPRTHGPNWPLGAQERLGPHGVHGESQRLRE